MVFNKEGRILAQLQPLVFDEQRRSKSLSVGLMPPLFVHSHA